MTDRAKYDREIRYTDDVVGRFIASLDRLGLRDDTVLIVTSDHGEEFGEHGRRYHGTNLHEETLHVPLLIRAPGYVPAGARRSGPMSMTDLEPTLLELLGLPPQTASDGTSRFAHLATGSPVEIAPIFHEATAPFALTYAGLDASWIPRSYGVTLWPYRAIRIRTASGETCEVFDLSKDPDERTNLSASTDRDPGTALCARLDGYETAEASILARFEARSSGGNRFGQALGTDPLSEERIKKLKALGYLQ